MILFGGSQASLSSSSPEVDKGEEKLVATLKAKSVLMKMIKLESQTSPCFGKDLKQGQNDCQAGWHVKGKVKISNDENDRIK